MLTNDISSFEQLSPGVVLNELKSRYFHASSWSKYDFSTLYKTLLHKVIKDKHDLIGKNKLKPYMPNGLFYLNSLDWSISNRKGVWSGVFFYYFYI